jgi:NADPH:quinone reductase-like Zn-dependent oxidoreductase
VIINTERNFMHVILREQFRGPDVLEIREMPEPEPKAVHAVIQVKAFGINHVELHMRKVDIFC